jgi:hypothetical protein
MRTPAHGRYLTRIAMAVAIAALTAGATGIPRTAWAAPETPTRPLTVEQISTITGLTPGGPAQAVDYAISNPNSSPVYVNAVTLSITGITYPSAAGAGAGSTSTDHPAGGAAPGCTAADFAVVAPDAVRQYVAPGRTASTRLTATRSGTLALVNTAANQDACKGVAVTLTISIR